MAKAQKKPTTYKCPTCEAPRGRPCVKTRGSNAGQPYPDGALHKARVQRAEAASASD